MTKTSFTSKITPYYYENCTKIELGQSPEDDTCVASETVSVPWNSFEYTFEMAGAVLIVACVEGEAQNPSSVPKSEKQAEHFVRKNLNVLLK
ncbi:MAG: hypothetical protein H7326_01555 [Bdellovibrionaceae bacterium]|nr:hypothetical protein [Pseudobdellovibrionaceae bacterium]